MKKKSVKRKSKKTSSKRVSKKISKRNPDTKNYRERASLMARGRGGIGGQRFEGPNYLFPEIGQIKTIKEAKEILSNYSMTIRKNDWDQYEVFPIDDPQKSFETNDLTDAVNTGVAFARRMINNLLRRDQYDESY